MVTEFEFQALYQNEPEPDKCPGSGTKRYSIFSPIHYECAVCWQIFPKLDEGRLIYHSRKVRN